MWLCCTAVGAVKRDAGIEACSRFKDMRGHKRRVTRDMGPARTGIAPNKLTLVAACSATHGALLFWEGSCRSRSSWEKRLR